MRRTAVIGLLTATILSGGLTQGVANAAPAQPEAKGLAPSCVHTSASGGIATVTLSYNNTCSSQQRVKFVIQRAVDSNCITVKAGYKGSYKSGAGTAPELDKVESC